MKLNLTSFLALCASVAAADETRQLDAHVHGVSALDIAIDGSTVAMELHAPGADIVGFEHAASSAEDRDAVAAAVAALARPLDLFVLPAAAGCTVIEASASLEIEDEHDGHDHEEHAVHDDHEEGDHTHDETAETSEATHSEFHAEYTLNCVDPSEITEITFAYFDTFENAEEIEVQIVTASGAQAFEATRDAPSLGLASLF